MKLDDKVQVKQSGDVIHEGIIVELTTTHTRVYDKESDVSPQTSELFAINSPIIKITKV